MTDSLSFEVIETVAADDVDANELSPPLHEVIHPEALDSVFRNGSGSVTFDYRDYRVTVDAEGDVGLAPLESR
jgi:hypothetical protein